MSAWSKTKAYVKKNPEDAMFWATSTLLIGGSLALTAYFVKLTADAEKEAIEAAEEERTWYREQNAQGKIIMYDAHGHPVAFNPLKPLYSLEP